MLNINLCSWLKSWWQEKGLWEHWCSSHLPSRHSVLTFNRDRTAQLSKERPPVHVEAPVLLAKQPEWRHHHTKHQDSNTLDTSAGISDNRMPHFLKNKKIDCFLGLAFQRKNCVSRKIKPVMNLSFLLRNTMESKTDLITRSSKCWS